MIGSICIAIVTLSLAQSPAPELDAAVGLLNTLDSAFVSVEYRQESLQHVIDDLAARIKMPVRADWNSLERLGISPSDPITMQLTGVSAATALAALSLSIGDDLERPVIEAHAGHIVLTRVAATAAMRLTAVYDVRDLLANETLLQRLRDESPFAVSQEPPPSSDPTPIDADADAVPDPDHPLLQSDRAPAADGPLRALSPGEKLILLITDHVDPEAWMNFGGNRALISEINGVLVMSATPSTHRRLRDALQLLRSANTNAITIEAAIIDLPHRKFDSINRQHARNKDGLAGAIVTDAEAQSLWRAADPIAVEARLDIESSGAELIVRVSIVPELNRTTGELRMTIEAGTIAGTDRRSVKTTASLVGEQRGCVIELPPASPSEIKRMLVLTVHRR